MPRTQLESGRYKVAIDAYPSLEELRSPSEDSSNLGMRGEGQQKFPWGPLILWDDLALEKLTQLL